MTAPAPAGSIPSFSNSWFDGTGRANMDAVLPELAPSRVLEVGSYEGASAVYFIEAVARSRPLDLHCIDTWEGGVEHLAWGVDMPLVQRRFHENVEMTMARAPFPVRLTIGRGPSYLELAKLIAEGRSGFYDLAYIDGSHQAPDVLADACLAFRLLRVGGVLAFDDYVWAEDLPGGKDPLRCPKPAIDAFVNIHFRKVDVFMLMPLYQLYLRKTAD